MGREIRRVPLDWEHPKDERGHYKPLFDTDYVSACENWYFEAAQYQPTEFARFYHEYAGAPPDEDKHLYRERAWTEDEAVGVQMYENVSEGTPVTPVFASREELAAHLTTRGTYWDQTPWSRQAAEQFVKSGYAPSFIVTGGKVYRPQDGFPEATP